MTLQESIRLLIAALRTRALLAAVIFLPHFALFSWPFHGSGAAGSVTFHGSGSCSSSRSTENEAGSLL